MLAASNKLNSGGLGLDDIGDLSDLLSVSNEPKTGPLMIPIDLVDEDPDQPRTESNPGFSNKCLSELAATIMARGVKSPISVRENPDCLGRFIINHGARRYRASMIAKKAEIPAYIDNDYLKEDQVIENLQRNELTAREIADYIGRMLSLGKKKSEIAKSIGKSPSFISQHVTLLDLPEPIADAFNLGRANDVTVVNELVTTYKKSPDEVRDWLSDTQELTRGSVKLLKEFLDDKGRNLNTEDIRTSETDPESGEAEGVFEVSSKKRKKPDPDPSKFKKSIVKVMHDNRPGQLILNRRPLKEGFAWIKYDEDGHEFEANLSVVTLLALIES